MSCAEPEQILTEHISGKLRNWGPVLREGSRYLLGANDDVSSSFTMSEWRMRMGNYVAISLICQEGALTHLPRAPERSASRPVSCGFVEV